MATDPFRNFNFREQFRQQTRKELIDELGDKLGRAAHKDLSKSYATAGGLYRDLVIAYSNFEKNEEALAKVNRRLAKGMREKSYDAYKTNVIAVRSAPRYRKEDRYSYGRLGRALQRSSMAIGTAEGIAFIDQDLLDKEARHWARLNFGAQPGEGRKPGYPHRKGRVNFGAGRGFPVELDDEMRPGFFVPNPPGKKGFFDEKGRFFIRMKKKGDSGAVGKITKANRANIAFIKAPKESKGISPRHYFDAGIMYLAENFAPFYREHFEDADRKASAKLKNVKKRRKP